MDAIFTARMWSTGGAVVITIPYRELENRNKDGLVRVTLEFIEEKKEE